MFIFNVRFQHVCINNVLSFLIFSFDASASCLRDKGNVKVILSYK